MTGEASGAGGRRLWLQCPRKAACPAATVEGKQEPGDLAPVGAIALDSQANGEADSSFGRLLACVLLFHPDRRPAGRRRPGRAVAAVGWEGGGASEARAACEAPSQEAQRPGGAAGPPALGDQGWASDIQGEPCECQAGTRAMLNAPDFRVGGHSNLGVHELKEKGLSTH